MRSVRGYTLAEMLTVLILCSVMMGIAVVNLKAFHQPSHSASAYLRGYFKQIRAKAMSQTAAYMVVPFSETQMSASYSDKCSDSFSSFIGDSKFDGELPSGAKFLNTSWSVCFNARGLADRNVTISIVGDDGTSKLVEILLGGATREL